MGQIHYFKLGIIPFNKIKNKLKTIELCLFDKKKQFVKINDVIIFSNGNKNIFTKVKNISSFENFKELYKNINLIKCGYDNNIDAKNNYNDMNEYYSVDEIKKYGVVAIEFEIIELWNAYDKHLNNLENEYLIRGENIPDNKYHLVCDIMVKHHDNTYLLMQRDFNKSFGGLWELSAGGSALYGETPLDCAKRELLEETGIKEGNFKELGVIVSNEYHSIFFEFLCYTDWNKEDITLQVNETINYKWLSIDEFKKLNKKELITTKMLFFLEELQ